MVISLLTGLLLGCSLLLLGLGLKKLILGIIGLALETGTGIFSVAAAFVLFPFLVLALLAFGDGRGAAASPMGRFRIVGCSGPLKGKTYELNAKHPSLEFGVEGSEVRFPARNARCQPASLQGDSERHKSVSGGSEFQLRNISAYSPAAPSGTDRIRTA